MTLRTRVAEVSATKNPLPVYRGKLAEDYDGIGEFVAVSMSLSSTSSALAKVAPGAATTGQAIPAGTPVSVVSQHGHLEVVSMGSKVATGYTLAMGENNELEATIEPVNLVTPNLIDFSGNTFVSSSGFEGGWGKLVQSGGLYNPDFELPPQELNVDLSEDNQLPYWNELIVNGTGTHVQVVDSQDAFSQVIRCSIDSDATVGAYTWIGQIIPRTDLVGALATFRYDEELTGQIIFDIILDWLDIDGNYIRRDGNGVVISSLVDAGPGVIKYYQSIGNTPPTNAAFLRLWIGLRRWDTDPDVAAFDILSVKLVPPPFLVTGSYTFDLVDEADQEAYIYFYPPLPFTPNVVLSTVKSTTSLYFSTVNSITKTGCNLRVIHRDGTVRTATVAVGWVAIVHPDFEWAGT